VPSRLRLALAIAVLAALAAAPAAARATLVFVRNPLKPAVWVAGDDGSGKRRVAPGLSPRVSPDGQTIAYMRVPAGRFYRPELMLAPADGSAPPHRLMAGWREPFTFAWSPDSSMIATVRGPELRPKRLVLIDVASGARRTVARGFFSGAGFSPDGSRLVYARAARETYPPHSDVYRVNVSGGRPLRLTHDHRSLSPLWSPARQPVCVRAPCSPPSTAGQIVFVKLLGAKRRRYGPKNELFLMGSSGGGVRRLTRTRVAPLLSGLTPTDWSADGNRLLAEFGGQDTSYAVTVNPLTGAQRPVRKAAERGLVGAALSADGSAILASTGGFEPGPRHNVVSVPYGGGQMRVLARGASEPDWNR
jgi:Tol biopolymer transport system component